MQRRAAFLFVLVSLFVTSLAQAQLSGNMDATMKQGDTQTFSVTLDFSNRGGYSGYLIILVTASPELTLGKTTISIPFNCAETPNNNDCDATVAIGATQKVTITQVLSVRSDAFRSSGSWTIDLIGDGLSGAVPKTGVITIPDAGPHVIMSKAPEGLERAVGELQTVGLDGADTIKLKNIGNALTTVSISLDTVGPFTYQDLSRYTLAPGEETGLLRINEANHADDPALDRKAGFFIGSLSVTGDGVDPSLAAIRLQLRIFPQRTTQTPAPQPEKNRVDVSAQSGGQNPSVIVSFANPGPGSADGLLFSNVPWLILSNDPSFSLQPGESKSATITIDVSKQQQALSATGGTGSLTGTLTFRFLRPASGKTGATSIAPLGDPSGTGSVSVTLVSTVAPTATNATIPPLTGIHEQLFLAGVGHVQGSVGLFISDLSIYPQVMRGNSSFRSLAVAPLDLYYTPVGGGTSRKATLATIAPPSIAAMGDLVGTVYGTTQQVGSLQIRGPGFEAGEGAVGVNANVFNVSGKLGTFGTSIPVFKMGAFQCGQDLTKKLYVTGLLKNSSGHTNFYVQETCGGPAKVAIDFYDPSGNKIGSTSTDVAPFTAVQLGSSVVPTGAVSAILSHAPGSAGGFVAYATPVDEASGDTWAQVDWPNQRNYQGSAPVIIPVAGATPGANNTYFRTDLSIMNTGSTPGSGTLRFYNRTGETIDKPINLNPLQTATYVDVTTTLFGISTPHVGYLVFTPSSSTFVLTSRNYSTPVGSNASFGTAVPTLALTSALRSGQIRRIGGIEDASPDAIAAARGATFRSNFGLIETTGQPATVKVTVYYNYTSSLTSTVSGASATFNLTPNQFMLVGLGSTIFGANRASLGELHNITVEFEVTGGTGSVLPFVSSVDNGTGDSTFRTE